MIFFYLRFINYVFTVFGIAKPFGLSSRKYFLIWYKIYSIIIIAGIIAIHVFTMETGLTLSSQKSLYIIYKINDMVINVWIIVLNSINGENTCITLYERIEKMLRDLQISQMNIRIISRKINLAFTAFTLIVIVFIVFEILKTNSFILLITLPTYLSTFHLVLHLVLILAILKLIKNKMSSVLLIDQKVQNNNFIDDSLRKLSIVKYLLTPNVRFLTINKNDHFDLKFLCRIYDDLSTCIQILEQHHGFQMLLTFWLLFTNAVFGITMFVCANVNYPILVAAGSILPFIWCFVGSFIDDQISKEVEQIDMFIVKYLIDFRCDQTRRTILQTFKQLVSTNRLQFTACGLFRLNYSMILGTIVNVITYSIILIQMFLSDTK